MSVSAQIDAVLARADLSDAEKRKAIHDLKAVALLDIIANGDGGAVQPFIGRSFVVAYEGANYTIQVTSCAIDGFGFLVIQANITRGGVTKTVARHIGNPPILSGQTENLAAAAAAMIASLWQGA